MKKKTLLEKLQFNMGPVTATGCIEWIGSKDDDGYGVLKLSRSVEHPHGLNQFAHRVAWAVKHGDAGSMHVLHSCDNPACCNVDHLFLGTNTDNIHDRMKKGRSVTKLDAKKVAYLKVSDKSQSDLAREVGTCQTNVSSIKRGRTWAHVTVALTED